MLFYVGGDPPQNVVDIELIQELMMKRFQSYSSNNLQCDTEEFNYYDTIIHLIMSVTAIQFPQFKDTFVKGELKIFREKLKCQNCASIKSELRRVVKFLDSIEKKEEYKKLDLARNLLQAIANKCGHAFKKNHSKSCEELKLTMPFTFPLRLVSRREVEVHNGEVIMPCGMWNKLLELIFEYLVTLELELFETCDELKQFIYEMEDDRLRQIIKKFIDYIRGGVSRIRKNLKSADVDVDSCHFPPCMSELHQILRKTHRLSYDSRYQYTLFLKDIGLSVEENIQFWENEYSKPALGACCTHDWKERHKRYKYQIQHLYGLIGSHGLKTSHSCEKFIRPLDMKMDSGCPFQHLSPENLEKCLPENIVNLPDVEDIFKYKSSGLPQKACAAYLRCQQKILPNRGINKRDVVGQACYVISPLHYYNMAKKL